MTFPMSWNEWAQHDGVGLAARVRKGELTAKELARQAAAGVAKVNPALSGVVELFDDVIADPAKDGANLAGPFAGLPFLMKDLGPTMKGRLQEMGSLLMRGNRASADTFLTGKFRQAGLNLIGRTTTPEFGVCSSADNPAVYVTRNPWDTDYTTCGSSAGSAAMVAAGVVPIAHATDGGGSIRIPAGVNGNIGLKVSRGVFSLAPHMSDLTGLVSIQGCQSRSVRDTAAFVDHARGAAPGEFMPFWTTAQPYSEMIKRDPSKLRIALSHSWGDYTATPEIAAELAKAGRFLEGLGHHVDYALPELEFRAAFEAQTTCYISNFAVVISNMLAARGLGTAAGRSHRTHEYPDLGSRPAYELRRAGEDARRVQHDLARLRRLLRAVGRDLDPDHGAADAEGRHPGISHHLRQPRRARLVRQSLALLRLHAARQSLRHAGDLDADGHAGPRPAAGHPGDCEAGQ
ncbi:Asp-tRNA(Asn)/Glu-tRNA(Gln) amidotransferase A subunit family amidase [Bradyrhizobium sp. GM6.1]